MSKNRDKVIESATRMIRSGGYNAFSFREIADEIGIKSSSVHYYFKRKEDLAVVVAEHYSEGFFEALEAEWSGKGSLIDLVECYGRVYLGAFESSGQACLCGILSHEAPALPAPVRESVSRFVEQNYQWLTVEIAKLNEGLSAQETVRMARVFYGALSGAMAVATLKQDQKWLEDAKDGLVALVSRASVA